MDIFITFWVWFHNKQWLLVLTAKLVFAGAIAFSLEKLDVFLKAEQRSAIKAMYEGRDVFVCLPTGYGNSLCSQTLPFVMDHKDNRAQASAVLVVSPLIAHLHSSLIALMEEQVQRLRGQGVKASSVLSTQSSVCATDYGLSTESLFFCSPESLVVARWRQLLRTPQFSDTIVAVVVHCP